MTTLMTIFMTIIPCGILLTILCSCTSYKVSWHPTPPLHGRSLAMFVSGPGLAYVIKPIRNLQLSNLLETILQNGIWCFGKIVLHWKKHPIPISTSWRPGMAACIWADPPADLPGTRYGAQSHQIRSETKALEPTIVSWEESQLSASWGIWDNMSILSQYTSTWLWEQPFAPFWSLYTQLTWRKDAKCFKCLSAGS